MRFSHFQLEKIAAWEPADDAFASVDPIKQFVRPALAKLTESERYQCYTVDDGGLSNYYSFAIYPSLKECETSRSHNVTRNDGDAILVYLSLMVPFGAIGSTSISVAPQIFDNKSPWIGNSA